MDETARVEICLIRNLNQYAKDLNWSCAVSLDSDQALGEAKINFKSLFGAFTDICALKP